MWLVRIRHFLCTAADLKLSGNLARSHQAAMVGMTAIHKQLGHVLVPGLLEYN